MTNGVLTQAPPPGWYVDPTYPGTLRWWDGIQWSAYTAPRLATPAAPVRQPKQPRRWIGRKGGLIIGAGFAFAWLFQFIVVGIVLQDGSGIPLMVLLGAFGMAAAFIYTMCFRLRKSDEISPLFLVVIFVIGGLASALIAASVEPLVGAGFAVLHDSANVGLVSLVGVIEEGSKIALVIIAGRFVAVRNARTGLFVGGAVGFGFSAVEDVAYGMRVFLDPSYHGHELGGLLAVTIIREITGPFAHPLWTSLLGAAVFAAWGSQKRFRTSGKAIGVFLLVSLTHSLYDSPIVLGALFKSNTFVVDLIGLLALVWAVLICAGGAVVWVLTARGINKRMFGVASPSKPRPIGWAPNAWGVGNGYGYGYGYGYPGAHAYGDPAHPPYGTWPGYASAPGHTNAPTSDSAAHSGNYPQQH